MITWKSKSVSLFLIVAIFAVCFSPLVGNVKKVDAITACASSQAKRATEIGLGTTAGATQAAYGVPVSLGVKEAVDRARTVAATENTDVKGSCLDGIGWLIAKALVAAITQSTVQWINSGFHGSPTFVSDPSGFLTNVADEQFVGIMTTLFPDTEGLADAVCSPFSLNIKLQLALSYVNRTRGASQVGCRLSDIATNISGAVNGAKQSLTDQYNDFTSGNFNNGGWVRWMDVTQNANNNKYGAKFNADIAVQASIYNAQGKEVKILDWGNGFHSITDGISNITNKILTPGAQVQSMLATTLNDPKDELKIADSIDEIVGALAQQLIAKAISGGVSALSDKGSGSNGSSFLEQIQNEANQTQTQANTNLDQLQSSQDQTAQDAQDAANATSTVITNISANKNTAQSSTYVNNNGRHTSDLAVDGQTDAFEEFNGDKNVAISQPVNGDSAWWQVDLGSVREVDSVKIFPRKTTQQGQTLQNASIIFSADPFPAGSVSTASYPSTNIAKQLLNSGNTEFPAPAGTMARYVRIQSKDKVSLVQLVEVQVFGK